MLSSSYALRNSRTSTTMSVTASTTTVATNPPQILQCPSPIYVTRQTKAWRFEIPLVKKTSIPTPAEAPSQSKPGPFLHEPQQSGIIKRVDDSPCMSKGLARAKMPGYKTFLLIYPLPEGKKRQGGGRIWRSISNLSLGFNLIRLLRQGHTSLHQLHHQAHLNQKLQLLQ
jgi:hypothetical protein